MYKRTIIEDNATTNSIKQEKVPKLQTNGKVKGTKEVC